MHHYTKNTVEADEYCRKCQKVTRHRIDKGRRGPCKECIKRLEEQPRPVPPATQGGLF